MSTVSRRDPLILDDVEESWPESLPLIGIGDYEPLVKREWFFLSSIIIIIIVFNIILISYNFFCKRICQLNVAQWHKQCGMIVRELKLFCRIARIKEDLQSVKSCHVCVS